MSGRAAGDRQSAAPACIGILLEREVDDSRDSGGIVASRRIGDDLDLVHHVCRQLREEIAELRGLERTRAPVDLHDHSRIAAQAHDIVDVDVDRRNAAQHVERSSAASCSHVAHDVCVAIRRELYRLLLGGDVDCVQLQRRRGQRNRSNVNAQ